MALLAGLMWIAIKKFERVYREFKMIAIYCNKQGQVVLHDLQQIKTRLHWSRERELKAQKSRKLTKRSKIK
jgi:tRNA 2-selenouridine synthase SelU